MNITSTVARRDCEGDKDRAPAVQIRDVNSGTFGFVELALDKSTGQQVAIKFIDRGEKVRLADAHQSAWPTLDQTRPLTYAAK